MSRVLTDDHRFLDSLSAKVHPTPLTVVALSELFQEFYTRAASQIATHIATLQSRLSREKSPARSVSSKTSLASLTTRRTSGSSTPGTEQQMLTASEVSDRKKARRQLELKRYALEEAVERLVCEKLYEKLWRHRSTDDEERDHKLRSRTAALSLVGIGLKELLISKDDATDDAKQEAFKKEEEITEWLSEARSFLQRMDGEKNPLGKLQHLAAAHKSIVDTLGRLFPASSSADEILPTLIYTLITIPPEHLNVISNLYFVQRFRANSKMDGESAYCLVNLEAAISFLETVDLTSLRSGESQGGPVKTGSRPTTPRSETGPMNLGLSQKPTSIQTEIPAADVPAPKASPRTKTQRRLSNLIQVQTNRIEAASDAVRGTILEGADQAMESINSTLDNSFKFLFGRLKEQEKTTTQAGGTASSVIPRTLEDARKLVSSPPAQPVEEDVNISATSSIIDHPLDDRSSDRGTLDSRLSDLFAGKRAQVRDRSADSNRSAGSSARRVAFANDKPLSNAVNPSVLPLSNTPPTPSAMESVRTLGNSLNPLNRLGNINPLSRFGRSATSPNITTPSTLATPPVSTPTQELPKQLIAPTESKESLAEAKAAAALEDLKKTTPPIRKFLEAKDAKDLRIGDVDDLLKDYQRLAGALRAAISR